jgi:hypothetical protein
MVSSGIQYWAALLQDDLTIVMPPIFRRQIWPKHANGKDTNGFTQRLQPAHQLPSVFGITVLGAVLHCEFIFEGLALRFGFLATRIPVHLSFYFAIGIYL